MSAEKRRPLLLRPEAMEIAKGDSSVEKLLSQIMYWYLPSKNGQPKMTMEHEGVLWIAKTGEDWMSETGLTLKRYKHALAILKKKGLIEVRLWAFWGKTMSHLRLLTLTPATDGPKCHTPLVPNDTPHWSHKDQPIVVNSFIANGIEPPIIEYIIDDIQINSELTFATDKALPKSMGKKIGVDKKGGVEEKNKEGEKEIEVGDILKAKKCNSEGESLTAFWVKQCSRVYEEPQKPLKVKEISQLKSLAQYLGGDARFVILWAIYHWGTFVQSAAIQAGLKGVPAQANSPEAIGFFFNHHAVAVNMMQSTAEKLEAEKLKKQPLESLPMPEYVPKNMLPDEEPASLEEVEAALAEFM